MSKPPLADRTKKELAELARRQGVAGWDGMSKDDLVRALTAPIKSKAKPAAAPKPAKTQAKPSANGTSKHAPTPAKTVPAPAAKKPAVAEPPPPKKAKGRNANKPTVEPIIPPDKDLSAKSAKPGTIRDQIALTVPDPFWIHAHWQLSVQAVQRAEAALVQDWHGAKPIIRLFDVTSLDTTSTSEAPVRDINIHGGCSHWYIDVPQPQRSYRADIGYLSRRGQFYVLARSNVVTPPKPGATETLDENWVNTLDEKAAERQVAAALNGTDDPFDDRKAGKEPVFGSGAALPGKLKKFHFELDAELIVYGKTDPTATITLNNERIALRPDGVFVQRYSLPDGRQIIPAVATSSDGMEEQTIVLAIERNIKRLDPMIHDMYGEN